MLDFTKTGIFGNLFNPVRKYFNRYQKAETAIASIIKSLDISSFFKINKKIKAVSRIHMIPCSEYYLIFKIYY